MQYRKLARTGLRVREIGLGGEGFSGKTQASAEERDYAMALAKRDAPSAWRSAKTCAQPKKSFVNKKERENI